jgi:S1-C subfamily serine protease
VLVNEMPVEETARLEPGDVLGFGQQVKAFEFRLADEAAQPRRWWMRLAHGLRHTMIEPLARRQTLVALVVLAVLAGVIWLSITQIKISRALQDLSSLVQRQQQTLLELTQRIEQTRKEVQTLKSAAEGEITLIGRLSATYSPSICLIEATYRFVERGTGRALREAQAGESGITVGQREESFQVTVEGTGPLVEETVLGTGFLVDRGLILTNLHVARPWWKNTVAEQLIAQGFQPRSLGVHAYFPTARRPFRLELAGESETYDLALCRFFPGDFSVPTPLLAPGDVSLNVGQPVVLLSYPTGVDALLARLDDVVAQEIVNTTSSSRVAEVTRELAARGLIRPLPTQGHITAVLPNRIVHDAATASGSSGGPLLNRDGLVVGVSFAMLTEFTASNFAVPISAVREFLRQQGIVP